MVWLKVILIINVLWISGCISNKAIQQHKQSPITMMDVYGKSVGQGKKDVAEFITQNLKEQQTFGYVKPYIPVINEPVVRKVWIPDHKSNENSDVMIAGHWNYVMIQPAAWFIDGKNIDHKFPVIVPSININQKMKQDKKSYGHNNTTDGKNI